MSAEAVDVERVAAVLLGVTWPDGGYDGMPSRKVAGMLASALLPLFAEVRAEGAEQGRGEERQGWADWLEGWMGEVCPTRPTPEAILEWLRADQRPFGCFTAPQDPPRDAQEGRGEAAGSGVGSVDGRDGGGL